MSHTQAVTLCGYRPATRVSAHGSAPPPGRAGVSGETELTVTHCRSSVWCARGTDIVGADGVSLDSLSGRSRLVCVPARVGAQTVRQSGVVLSYVIPRAGSEPAGHVTPDQLQRNQRESPRAQSWQKLDRLYRGLLAAVRTETTWSVLSPPLSQTRAAPRQVPSRRCWLLLADEDPRGVLGEILLRPVGGRNAELRAPALRRSYCGEWITGVSSRGETTQPAGVGDVSPTPSTAPVADPERRYLDSTPSLVGFSAGDNAVPDSTSHGIDRRSSTESPWRNC